MHPLFSQIAFACRTLCNQQGVTLSYGHVQQLLAAVIGYSTLAGYQAASAQDQSFDASHLVLDEALFATRFHQLGCGAAPDVVGAALWEALNAALTETQVHRNTESFGVYLQEFVDAEITDDDAVTSQTAMTNGEMPMAEVPVEVSDADIANGANWLQFPLEGVVTVDQDQERVFYGDTVDVEGTLQLKRMGERAFGEPEIFVNSAGLRWLGEEA
ncbi:MAG TPA: hypothetical protein VJ698_20610 [Noviherbaspirillum sp.]|uniref:hypothetical protein n=1 Tax=Noviherbaspirillum sp. TaxID=1926288 RepID=UPI002B4A9D0A|nr:hypothetical protein [Noviherbaspirillum sp.]HJV87885.1 hypothetical protein [Noviherbaspirillum sp.]